MWQETLTSNDEIVRLYRQDLRTAVQAVTKAAELALPAVAGGDYTIQINDNIQIVEAPAYED